MEISIKYLRTDGDVNKTELLVAILKYNIRSLITKKVVDEITATITGKIYAGLKNHNEGHIDPSMSDVIMAELVYYKDEHDLKDYKINLYFTTNYINSSNNSLVSVNITSCAVNFVLSNDDGINTYLNINIDPFNLFKLIENKLFLDRDPDCVHNKRCNLLPAVE